MTDRDDAALEQLRARLLERVSEASTAEELLAAAQSVLDEDGEVLADVIRHLAADEAEVVVDQEAGNRAQLSLGAVPPIESTSRAHISITRSTTWNVKATVVASVPAAGAVASAGRPDVTAQAELVGHAQFAAEGVLNLGSATEGVVSIAHAAITFADPMLLPWLSTFLVTWEPYVQGVLAGDFEDVALAHAVTLALAFVLLLGATYAVRRKRGS